MKKLLYEVIGNLYEIAFPKKLIKDRRSLLFKFRKYAPHALKGQKLLAQGIALGNDGCKSVAL